MGLSQPLWPQAAYLQVKGLDQIKSEILKLHLIICISKSEDTPYYQGRWEKQDILLVNIGAKYGAQRVITGMEEPQGVCE